METLAQDLPGMKLMKMRWPRRLCRIEGGAVGNRPWEDINALKVGLRGWEETVGQVKDRRGVVSRVCNGGKKHKVQP